MAMKRVLLVAVLSGCGADPAPEPGEIQVLVPFHARAQLASCPAGALTGLV